MESKRAFPVLRVATEFLLIVVGVLTALAVDEWRRSLDERALLAEYLEALAADIAVELTYLDTVAELSRSRMAAADRVLLFLGREPGPSDSATAYVAPTDFIAEDLPRDLSTSSKVQFFVPEAVAWGDLTTTGNLHLVKDAQTRRRVARYYTQIRYQTRDLDLLERRFEALSSYLLERGIAASSSRGTADHVSSLTLLPELPAYMLAVRDTQAEVLERTLSLREYAETALEAVTR